MSMTIQNVRHPDGSCADLFLEDGRIQQVGPAGSLAAGTESSIDGDGYLLLPPSVTAMPIWTKPPWALTGSKRG